MMVTFALWWTLLARLALIRDSFAGNPISVEQDIFNAATAFANYKVAAVATLAALTLRLFKYFAYQQRLAVISESIARGFGDALHFLLLLGVLVVFFCIWGYFMFGTQVRKGGGVGAGKESRDDLQHTLLAGTTYSTLLLAGVFRRPAAVLLLEHARERHHGGLQVLHVRLRHGGHAAGAQPAAAERILAAAGTAGGGARQR
jgi:hypothetical protein